LTVLLSVPLTIEYEAVLTRPEHLRAANASASDVSALLDELVSVAEAVELAFLWRPALRDPDDDMVLELAANGRADAIVTFNLADFEAADREFGITVMTPGAALVAWRRENEEK
jgi:predicted nucleic acid-binding protein